MTAAPEFPILPYGHGPDANSGFVAGVDTSEDRARSDDADGVTGKRQREAYRLLGSRDIWRNCRVHDPADGLTWKEVDTLTGWHHHGRTTGALSNLHKAGLIACLVEKRDRCHIYVLPEYVNGRETRPHGPRRRAVDEDPAPALGDALVALEARVAQVLALHAPDEDGWCSECSRHTSECGTRAILSPRP